MITLRAITEANFDECLRLGIHEHQRGFVATNVKSLAQAWLCPDVARPFAIYHGEEMVGFVMLDEHKAEKECGIWRFMIDKDHQGKGYGRAAMECVLRHIRENPAFERVCLSFEPENEVAEKLYRSFGFAPTGEIDEGEIVMELRLTE